ncbi:hypothetical protein D6D18_10443, partial [Aureobasidium pullulans]
SSPYIFNLNTESVVRYAFPVIAAAAVGNQQILELLLQNGADINSKCKEYGNALHVAIEKGNTPVVNTLVELGLTAQFRSELRWTDLLAQAVRKSKIQIVKLLLNSHLYRLGPLLRNRSTHNPVREAFSSDDAEMVETFLGLFLDVRYHRDALRIASGVGKHSIVLALLDFSVNADACSHALLSAACGGHKTIVRMLLDRGADINALGGYDNDTALYAASQHAHETIVRLLLDHGADVDRSRHKPLHAALRMGYPEIVSLLLESGADMDTSSDGYPNALAAAEACIDEQERIVLKQMLLDEKRKRQRGPNFMGRNILW